MILSLALLRRPMQPNPRFTRMTWDTRLIAERGRDPKFSPDGQHVAYWAGTWLGGVRVGSRSSVSVVPSMGGRSTRIAESFFNARNPVWSPDGKGLLFWGRKAANED